MHRCALVIGGTGFIATELIKQLLEKGYDVIATVRDPESAKAEYLQKLGAAFPGSLELVQGDITTPGVFDEAIKKVQYVFHTASPVILRLQDGQDAQRDIIDVAVQGTENTLNSVAEHGQNVRRVILTSGLAAACSLYSGKKELSPSDWNEDSSIENNQAYPMSKMLQEKRAWEVAKAKGIDLVAILPSMTIGPVLSPHEDCSSYQLSKMTLFLKKPLPGFNPVDVRDVAKAHILAAEAPEAHGRYFVSLAGIAELMVGFKSVSRLFPNYRDLPAVFDACKSLDVGNTEQELGFRPRDPACFYADAVRTYLRLNLL